MLQAVELTIRLHPDDDVVIARLELATGTLVSRENVRTAVTIPAGHKLAVRDVAQGKPVRRYNQIIGFATRDINAGEHVHVHNLAMGDFQRDYAFCALRKETEFLAEQATFQGIVRADGRVATRNFIGILTSVNCSATVARMVADHFKNRLDPSTRTSTAWSRSRTRRAAAWRPRAKAWTSCGAPWRATRATRTSSPRR